MKSPFILSLLLVFSISCSRQAATETTMADRASPQTAQATAPKSEGDMKSSEAAPEPKTALAELNKAAATNEAADRRIIRNADITIEVASTTEAQQRVTSIAEFHGGFVVTSEAKQRQDADPSKRTLDVKLVVRIPANQFGPAFDEITRLASNLPEANVSGQDVTEDFIDLEARIKTQKALELQFLEIMKQAHTVEDALEVQSQIADVRADIERLEGRKRFLENRSSLSTITVNIRTPKIIEVNPTGIRHTVREAVAESLEMASGMLTFFIRFVILMVPIFVFVLLPAGLVIRYLVRRAKRIRLAQALATPSAS